jgi:hypothetical protein
MLTAGQSHSVKFKVNVMGTSAEPRVRLILGTNPELSFAATKDGDDWASNMEIPSHIAPGNYDMRVEVHLNNRLFTPINRKIDVKGIALAEPVKAASVSTGPESPLPMALKPEVNNDAIGTRDLLHSIAMTAQGTSIAAPVSAKIKAPEMPKVVAKLPKIEPKITEPAPAAAPEEPAVLSLLAKVAKTPAAPMKKRFESKKLPASAPIRVTISEVDAVTTKSVAHIVEKYEPIKAPRRKAKVGTPVKLVKEQLFYE